MEQNKVRTYFLYAVGEIALVVIGILLALQINTWSEEKRALVQEQSTLVSLQQEVYRNIEIASECSQALEETIHYADQVRSYLSPDVPDVPVDSVNKWFGNTGNSYRCFILTDILDELQSSGNLKNIRDVELRRQIGTWGSALENLSGEEQEWAEEFSRDFIPYMNKWISWDDVDYMFNEDNNPAFFQSRFETDPRDVLQQYEFSNLYSIHYWRMNRVDNRIDSLLVETQKLKVKLEENIHRE